MSDFDTNNPLQAVLAKLPTEFEPSPADSPRGRIMIAARNQFAEKGFTATSIRSIANSASVNLAMVNYYFSTKAALYQRVITAELIETFRVIKNDFPPGLPPAELVLRLPIAIAKVMRNNPVWAQLIRRELADGAPHFRLVFEELGGYGPKGLKEAVVATFFKGMEEGTLKQFKPMDVVPTLIALGYGMVIIEPILSIVAGRKISEDDVWEDRLSGMEQILRDGLLAKKKDKQP